MVKKIIGVISLSLVLNLFMVFQFALVDGVNMKKIKVILETGYDRETYAVLQSYNPLESNNLGGYSP